MSRNNPECTAHQYPELLPPCSIPGDPDTSIYMINGSKLYYGVQGGLLFGISCAFIISTIQLGDNFSNL